jgi:hypothetical protein
VLMSWKSDTQKGEDHVNILQESHTYVRGSCGGHGALRNAGFGRAFGNIRLCFVD